MLRAKAVCAGGFEQADGRLRMREVGDLPVESVYCKRCNEDDDHPALVRDLHRDDEEEHVYFSRSAVEETFGSAVSALITRTSINFASHYNALLIHMAIPKADDRFGRLSNQRPPRPTAAKCVESYALAEPAGSAACMSPTGGAALDTVR